MATTLSRQHTITQLGSCSGMYYLIACGNWLRLQVHYQNAPVSERPTRWKKMMGILEVIER